MRGSKAAVFIDRDGVINQTLPKIDMGKAEKYELIPGAREALERLSQHGINLFIISNQNEIGEGYFSHEDFRYVDKHIREKLLGRNVKILKTYYCPHTKDFGCNCRKPKTGMLEQAKEEFGIDLPNSVVIGDRSVDIQLGKNCGCITIQILNEYSYKEPNPLSVKADYVVANISHAADLIIQKFKLR